MEKVSGTQTENDLKEAFAGESQANRRYLAYAVKAEQEGQPGIAKLFRAVAEAETIHAHAHLRILGAVNSTADNLQDAISGETHEFTAMYPAMIENAVKEGNEGARRTFTFANEVEKVHAELFQAALEKLQKGEDQGGEYYVCKVCGHTIAGEPEGSCPTCKAPKTAFYKVG
jgi:rubrerythrin